MGDGLFSQLDAGSIDFGDLGRQAVAREAKTIRAEGIGLDDFGAGLQVILMDGKDQIRIGQVEFVVAAVDEDAAGVKHRAHGAVCEHGAAGKDIGKLTHYAVILSQGS